MLRICHTCVFEMFSCIIVIKIHLHESQQPYRKQTERNRIAITSFVPTRIGVWSRSHRRCWEEEGIETPRAHRRPTGQSWFLRPECEIAGFKCQVFFIFEKLQRVQALKHVRNITEHLLTLLQSGQVLFVMCCVLGLLIPLAYPVSEPW